jgi:hypothetical protein
MTTSLEPKLTRETRRLKAGENLINIMIKDQAGTLEKALTEGFMNSIDAKATELALKLSETDAVITDNGKGIQTRKEIEDHFETVGFKHKEGDAKFGRYRIGRGQMFCFAHNTWRTGTFKLEVDYKHEGLNYDLISGYEKAHGTHIEMKLYERLTTQELIEIPRNIAQLVKFVEIPITINGKKINKDRKDIKWTHDEPTFLACVKPAESYSSVTIYNQGVLVEEYRTEGITGIIVTKEAIAVNTARNQAKRNCPIFRAIKNLINKESGKLTTKTKMTDAIGIAIINKLVRGEKPENIKTRFIPSIHNSRLSLNMISRRINKLQGMKQVPVIFASDSDKGIDKIDQHEAAIILSSKILENNEFEPIEIVNALSGNMWFRRKPEFIIKTTEDFDHLVNSTYTIIPAKKHTKKEKLILSTLQKAYYQINRHLADIDQDFEKKYQHDQPHVRTLEIGESDTAQAWTDGVSYIRFNKSTFTGKSGDTSIGAWHNYINLLIHEMCHGESSQESHEHTLDFYRKFHELQFKVGNIAIGCWRQYLKVRETEQKREPGQEAAAIEIMAQRQDIENQTFKNQATLQIDLGFPIEEKTIAAKSH